ncbi:MAG: hypothetical protein QGH39_06245 [Candidatus Thermoplasmatota archaeon]|jgi:hypothetical protein|nr:hypothetical protein [Candidatus Thermoplasmatota archaeon]MDP7265143.1 hypothetical protein [Candidatus Thermoplasmatota archaeon]
MDIRGRTMDRRKIPGRITGLEIFNHKVDGVPDDTEREKVLEMIRFFEDRKVLYHPFRLEAPSWITDAVIVVRNKITEMLEYFDTKSPTTIILLTMRGACRKYLEATSGIDRKTYVRDVIIPFILSMVRSSTKCRDSQLDNVRGIAA